MYLLQDTEPFTSNMYSLVDTELYPMYLRYDYEHLDTEPNFTM